MFLATRRFGIAAPLLMAAGALLGLAGQATANEGNGPDVSFGIWIGSGWRWEPGCDVRPPRRDCDYAGTLTIDGRSFRIDTSCSVRAQIREAFEYMGYDAWYVGGSVRVHKDHCGPEVCWRTGEYSISFRERRTTITITPFETCDDHHDHGGVRYGFSREHGRYFAYSEVQGNRGGESEWRSMGMTAFVDSERDQDDELRIDSREERRERSDDAGVGERTRVIDGRTSVPTSRQAPGQVDASRRDSRDTDKRVGSEAALKRATAKAPEQKAPSTLKRSTDRRDTAMPTDRLGDLKRATPDPVGTKATPRTGPSVKEKVAPKTGAKPSDDRKGKW